MKADNLDVIVAFIIQRTVPSSTYVALILAAVDRFDDQLLLTIFTSELYVRPFPMLHLNAVYSKGSVNFIRDTSQVFLESCAMTICEYCRLALSSFCEL